MRRALQILTNGFALWVVLGTVWAWYFPDHFKWFVAAENRVFGVKLIHLGLGLIMFGMGITLSFDDFRSVLKMPLAVAAGVAAQFLVMPLLGFGLAHAFKLETALAVGLILVSCCPGGTASNVVTYLARASLPLSVLMTMCSTLAAIALTPLLTGWLGGTYVDIDRWNLFVNMIAVVLVPVLAGLVLHQTMPRLVRFVTPWSPVLSVAIIVLIVGGIIGASRDKIIEHAGTLLLVVFLLHAGGFLLGYAIAVLLRFPIAFRRTLSIEVGMQNSGLGSSLAKTDKFQAQFATPLEAALAPVPSAVSALYHCVIGSMLAAYWRWRAGTPAERRAGLFWGVRVLVAALAAWLFWGGWPILGTCVTCTLFGHWLLDVLLNRVAPAPGVEIDAEARALHESAFVVDLHADICLWPRDHINHGRRGHVDLPRLFEGGVALQFVTMPTKLVLSPRMPRLFLTDIFFWGSVLSLERPGNWLSVANRARAQFERFERWIAASDGRLMPVRDQRELAELQQRRERGEQVVGLMLGLEGAHALRGEIDVGWLAERGFRVLGLTHFNDNRFADSAHGWRKRGLKPAGRELLKELEASEITIDLAHGSTAVIDDVLEMCAAGELRRPLLVSHTGLKGDHDHRRNILDRQAVEIARRGGLIGISFFKPALTRCDLDALVDSVCHCRDILDEAGLDGACQVAFGSDFDGAVKTVIDAAGWPSITAALLRRGFSAEQARFVLGENALRFLERNLPEGSARSES